MVVRTSTCTLAMETESLLCEQTCFSFAMSVCHCSVHVFQSWIQFVEVPQEYYGKHAVSATSCMATTAGT
eukprot:5060310-Amphidinium_carterae.2